MFRRTNFFVTIGLCSTVSAILLFVGVSSSSVSAKPQLAATEAATVTPVILPDKSQIKINSHGKFAQVKIGVPNTIQAQLTHALASLTPLATATNPDKKKLDLSLLDINSPNYAVDSGSGDVTEIEIPLSQSGAASATVAEAQIADGPIKIVGAIYNPAFSKSALLVALTVPDPKVIEKGSIAFIDPDGQRHIFKDPPPNVKEPTLELRKFTGVQVGKEDNGHNDGRTDEQPDVNTQNDSQDGGSAKQAAANGPAATADNLNKPVLGDRGGTITARETCFTVGLDQVCYNFTILDSAAVKGVSSALETLRGTFDLKPIKDGKGTNWDIEAGSVGDLVGDTLRLGCEKAIKDLNDQFKKAPESLDLIPSKSLSACEPNVYFAAPVVTGIKDIRLAESQGPFTKVIDDTKKRIDISTYPIIGIMDVKKPFEVDTFHNKPGELFDLTGQHIDPPVVPIGHYLILSLEPKVDFGEIQYLMLIDAQQNAVILPGLHVEAFGAVKVPNGTNAPFYQAFIKDPGVCQGMLP